jgi:hypothetical protein
MNPFRPLSGHKPILQVPCHSYQSRNIMQSSGSVVGSITTYYGLGREDLACILLLPDEVVEESH